MNNYFNTNIHDPKYQQNNIFSLLNEKNHLVAGDFWGIQNFIFEKLSTKNAAKVLRAKSAFIQIFMQILAKYICKKAQIDEKHILTTNSGKFEIIVPKDLDIEPIQKEVNEYFLKNFYGLSGVGICKVEVSKDEWKNDYKNFRKKLAEEIEKLKFKKFNLTDQNPILKYDTNLTNETLCKICNIRKIEKENCNICNIFIALGKQLTYGNEIETDSKKLGIDFIEEPIKIILNKRIKSYIPSKDQKPLEFEEIANNSCKGKEIGIKALGILKADVDGMGNFIKNSNPTESFNNFDEFSKGIDSFFSIYITDKLRNDFRNIYTVFSGGDDLFLVGAWDEILSFSRELRNEFIDYVNLDLTLSFGIAIAKPTTPISYLANHTEELLEKSKSIDGKDSITIWNETIKWKNYLKVFKILNRKFKDFEVNSSSLYKLLELCDMSKSVKNDIKNTIWRSKLNYLFRRNIDKKYFCILKTLEVTMKKFPKETKVFLYEYIYKNRKN